MRGSVQNIQEEEAARSPSSGRTGHLLPHRGRSSSSTLTEWNHRSYKRNTRMDGMDGMDENEAVPATFSRTMSAKLST